MALIYDSSHSGQEIDAAVDAVQTTIPSQLATIGSKLGELGTHIGLISSDIFEIGNIYISTSGWTYASSTTRVRMKQGITIHLHVGDVVSLSDYTDARFYLGCLKEDGTYWAGGWFTADYTISYDGDYVVLLSNVTEVAQSSITALYSLLTITTATYEDVFESAKKNTQRFMPPSYVVGQINAFGIVTAGTNNAYRVYGFFDVIGGKTYTISCPQISRIVYFDKDYKFISVGAESGENVTSIAVPSGVVYMRIGCYDYWQTWNFSISLDEQINVYANKAKTEKGVEDALLGIDAANSGNEYLAGDWEIGFDYQGTLSRNYRYRVSTLNVIKYDRDITITANSGYKFAVHYFSDESTYSSDSGWKNSLVVPANTYFKVVVAKSTEDTSLVLTDYREFYHQVSIKSYLYGRIENNEELEVLNAQFNALPITKDTKTQDDYGTEQKYVRYSDGAFAVSGNFKCWTIKNTGVYKIVARLGYSDTIPSSIAFYNGTPSTGTYMRTESIQAKAGANDYETGVPEGCKYIVICNKTPNLAAPTFTLYRVVPDVVTDETILADVKEAGLADADLDLEWQPGGLNDAGKPSGNYTDPTPYHRTDFVEVLEGATYTTNVNLAADTLFICFYDKLHKLVYKLTRSETYNTFTVKDGIGVRYCRLVTYSSSMTSEEAKRTFYLRGRQGKDMQLASLAFVEDSINGTDIFALNTDREVRPKILNALKPLRGNTTTPLCLIHFSDIHADDENLERILAFKNYYQNYVADIINTGDMVGNSSSDGFSWWAAKGADSVLNVVGNHDSATYSGGSFDWTGFGKVNCYNTYLAPFIANWGVVQPADAATNGYNYYYKDYSAQSIRLIVLDDMFYDTTQNTWLEGVLADALTNNLSVIIAKHYPPAAYTRVDCTFDYIGTLAPDTRNNGVAAVAAFMTNGGKFIAWIVGHYHCDLFGTLVDYPNQLVIGIDTAKGQDNYAIDGARVRGTKTQDSFNILTIDADTNLVKIIRIGQNYDRLMRHKNSLCYNYSTKTLISND